MHLKTESNRYYVYIVTDTERKILKPGVTGDLEYRMARLRDNLNDPAVPESECTLLVYWEMLDDAVKAITRSEEIARWSRRKKEALVEQQNPEWNNLDEHMMIVNYTGNGAGL